MLSLLLFCLVCEAMGAPTNMVWPLPKQVSFGSNSVCLNGNDWAFEMEDADPIMEDQLFVQSLRGPFALALEIEDVPRRVAGSQKNEQDLKDAFARYTEIMFGDHVAAGKHRDGCIASCTVKVKDMDVKLDFGVNESYSLLVDAENGKIVIEAVTIYGAMHGMESLSQLVRFNFNEKQYVVRNAPWKIEDDARFAHREVLIDSSRHFLSMQTLKAVIRTLPYSKINTLHWHIEDTQSFPYCSEKMPKLCTETSWSEDERYTREDLVAVVDYARKHGVRVVVELDVPGHTDSWCRAYPEICTAAKKIISPVGDRAKDAIAKLLQEFREIFPDGMIHLGGDEVNMGEWERDPASKAYMAQHNMSANDVYESFVSFAHKTAQHLGYQTIGWSEIWASFQTKLTEGTILQKWRTEDSIKSMTSKGYRVLWSDASAWYLDHLRDDWNKTYRQEPCTGLSDDECKLVMGGGGEMWGEQVDGSDQLQTIWPRLASIGERLWSPRERTQDLVDARDRLLHFRCILLNRGVPAAPVTNEVARTSPQHPGSCRT